MTQVKSPDQGGPPGLRLRGSHRSWLESTELFSQVAQALTVGVVTALGALVFRELIDLCHRFFFEWLPAAVHFFSADTISVALLPALGGLLVGFLIYYGAREAEGHGVPEVMYALAMNGGRIRKRVAAVKAISSAVTIGSGGSAGREGPIVQIGAALGSAIGQRLHMNEERISLLVACGAAAGISATFNAPVAGVFFALEVILGEFASRSFAMVVLASVTSSVISRAILGDYPAFVTPRHTLVHPSELSFYLVLGVLAGLVGILYTRAMAWSEEGFEKLRTFRPLKPALGGFAVGALGLWFPAVMGNGYQTISLALNSKLATGLMATLVLGKMAATALTLGSGGSGGVFAPALFIGAMLGGAFGGFVHQIVPSTTAEAGAYALVGMAAVFAASAHAPITAVLILFELTGDYRIILPLMAATVVAVLISSLLQPDSIYGVKLRKLGVEIHEHSHHGDNPLRAVSVGEVMTVDYQAVSPRLSIPKLIEMFNRTGHHGFPVADDNGRLVGMVALKDLEYARLRGTPISKTSRVSSITTTDIGYVCPEDSVHFALRLMGRYGVGRLPVVDSPSSRKLLGVLRRADIINAYNQVTEAEEASSVSGRLRVSTSHGADFLEIALPSDSPLAGLRVREVNLPAEVVLVAVRRGTQITIPRGDTELAAHDVVVAFTRHESRAELRALLGSHKEGRETPVTEAGRGPAQAPGTTAQQATEARDHDAGENQSADSDRSGGHQTEADPGVHRSGQ